MNLLDLPYELNRFVSSKTLEMSVTNTTTLQIEFLHNNLVNLF